MPFQFSLVQGKEGQVLIPLTGQIAGTIRSWSLRREESGPFAGTWTLHAALSYAHEKLLSEPSLSKSIVVTLARNPVTKQEKKYRVECEVIRLEDPTSLVGERGTLWPVE